MPRAKKIVEVVEEVVETVDSPIAPLQSDNAVEIPESISSVVPDSPPALCQVLFQRHTKPGDLGYTFSAAWHGDLDGFVWVSAEVHHLAVPVIGLEHETRYLPDLAPYRCLAYRLSDDAKASAVYLRHENNVPAYRLVVVMPAL